MVMFFCSHDEYIETQPIFAIDLIYFDVYLSKGLQYFMNPL